MQHIENVSEKNILQNIIFKSASGILEEPLAWQTKQQLSKNQFD